MKGHKRWSITDAPPQQPGVDWLTRTSVGPFIDTGVDVARFGPSGRIYLSVDTIREMADIAGLFDPPEDEKEAHEAEIREAYLNGFADGTTGRQELYNALRYVADGLGLLDDSAAVDGGGSDGDASQPAEDSDVASESAEAVDGDSSGGAGEETPRPTGKKRKAGGSKLPAAASSPVEGPDDVSNALGNDDSERSFRI